MEAATEWLLPALLLLTKHCSMKDWRNPRGWELVLQWPKQYPGHQSPAAGLPSPLLSPSSCHQGHRVLDDPHPTSIQLRILCCDGDPSFRAPQDTKEENKGVSALLIKPFKPSNTLFPFLWARKDSQPHGSVPPVTPPSLPSPQAVFCGASHRTTQNHSCFNYSELVFSAVINSPIILAAVAAL